MTQTLHVQINCADCSDLKERLKAIDAGEEVNPSELFISPQ